MTKKDFSRINPKVVPVAVAYGPLTRTVEYKSFHYKSYVTVQMWFHKGGHTQLELVTYEVVARRASTVIYAVQ